MLNKFFISIHFKIRSSSANGSHIKILNKEIGSYFSAAKACGVRQAAMGKKVNLWKAVKLAKNMNSESIPTSLTLGGSQ